MTYVLAGLLSLLIVLQFAAATWVPASMEGPSGFWMWPAIGSVFGYFLCKRIPGAALILLPLFIVVMVFLLDGGWHWAQDGERITLAGLSGLRPGYLLYALSILCGYAAAPLGVVLGWLASRRAPMPWTV